jgi:transposase
MFHHLASRGAWGCFLRRPPQKEDRVHTIKRVSIERLSKAIWEDRCKPLRVGKVVVMYNLSAHKGQRVRKLIEDSGCELLYLPPYSPDLNPIEEAFSKVKGLLRSSGPGRKRRWWSP